MYVYLRQCLLVACLWVWADQSSAANRIVGGFDVEISKAPGTVALLYRARVELDGNLYNAQFCAGTVIDPFWVLTAAHCVVDHVMTPEGLMVLAGSTDLTSPDNQPIGVLQVIVHEDYVNTGSGQDIALLRLENQAGVAAVALASDTPEFNQAGLITGWGAVNATSFFPIQIYPARLRAALVRIIPGLTCSLMFPEYNNRTGNTMLCAGVPKGGVDSCQGDSGGPLFRIDEDTRDIISVAGITSWGIGCGAVNRPGVYTNISSYADWIQEKAADSNLSFVGNDQAADTDQNSPFVYLPDTPAYEASEDSVSDVPDSPDNSAADGDTPDSDGIEDVPDTEITAPQVDTTEPVTDPDRPTPDIEADQADPSEPAVSEPTPSEPAPSESTPSEPTPSEPAPSEPVPSEPAGPVQDTTSDADTADIATGSEQPDEDAPAPDSQGSDTDPTTPVSSPEPAGPAQPEEPLETDAAQPNPASPTEPDATEPEPVPAVQLPDSATSNPDSGQTGNESGQSPEQQEPATPVNNPDPQPTPVATPDSPTNDSELPDSELATGNGGIPAGEGSPIDVQSDAQTDTGDQVARLSAGGGTGSTALLLMLAVFFLFRQAGCARVTLSSA